MSRVLGNNIFIDAMREKKRVGIMHHAIILQIAHKVLSLRSIARCLLILDLCTLVSVRQALLVMFKSMRRIMAKACLMGFGAGLLFLYISMSSQHSPIRYLPVSYHQNSESIKNEILHLSDRSRLDSSVLEQEIALLRRKTLSLDMTIRRMKMQLRCSNVCLQRDEELPDFASEAAGGSIISTPNTETYFASTEPEVSLFGIPIWKINYFTPRKVIQPWTEAGECWAFHGSSGKIVIELAYAVFISHVTVEHIPASASLTGVIDSAPKEFTLSGKFKDEFVKLDSFTYNINSLPTQTFPIRSELKGSPFKRVLLHIHSNWGNSDYTCIYRLKVRGRIHKDLDNSVTTKRMD